MFPEMGDLEAQHRLRQYQSLHLTFLHAHEGFRNAGIILQSRLAYSLASLGSYSRCSAVSNIGRQL